VSDTPAAKRQYETIPPALWVIAILALAPFPISAAAYGFGSPDVARPALTVILTWSAVILGFLGGVRWGLETGRPAPRWERQAISVLSPLAAFLLLMSRHRFSDAVIIGGCIAAFLLQWLFDHQAPDVPARYPRLSTAMAGAACISLAVCLDQALRTNHIVL
jgi:hypothetical protein